MSLVNTLADIRNQYAELGRLLDAKAAHERAEHAEQLQREAAREEAALPAAPAREANGRFASVPAPLVADVIREACLAMRGLP